ncbi:malonate decarboxylase holo-[acyl-carrier-protein] synthase [Variovorax sp. S2]|uniref:malonate decarboxylase holo-[acyl-carrier-protein] synthase n=1 Tax=Variovorax sp. S12S4 TaxID=3029170 RepID=UPI00215D000D|nr:malonate decarboxylase holo-[acyl-carrier-protein] synthase [Variovorax sp. S12S4]MCR8960673.1 malonate decarboxylase holo-[acyl-carrier-protein] synthase [Variovorax sp. S12S4]
MRTTAMAPLRRHQLARLSTSGWAAVLGRPWDEQARECLAHWASHQLPLVVTRQPADSAASERIALGLPAPARWAKRRLALQVPHTAVLGLDEFPRLAGTHDLLPPPAQDAIRELLGRLDECHATARVFGSYGWQAISGLDHVHAASDLDLSVTVEGAAHADAVARALASFEAPQPPPPRLDGELLFNDGSAVAWREWSEWRAGRARAVLVKRLDGVSLRRDTAWCEHVQMTELAA